MKEASKPTPAFTDTNSTDLLLGFNDREFAALDGLLDEARVFNCALTAAEIKADYDATKGEVPPSGDCSVSHWPAENNTSDFVGTNHGTAVGGLGYAAGKVGQSFSIGSRLESFPALTLTLASGR